MACAPLGLEDAMEILLGGLVFLIVFLPILILIVRIITAANDRANHQPK